MTLAKQIVEFYDFKKKSEEEVESARDIILNKLQERINSQLLEDIESVEEVISAKVFPAHTHTYKTYDDDFYDYIHSAYIVMETEKGDIVLFLSLSETCGHEDYLEEFCMAYGENLLWESEQATAMIPETLDKMIDAIESELSSINEEFIYERKHIKL